MRYIIIKNTQLLLLCLTTFVTASTIIPSMNVYADSPARQSAYTIELDGGKIFYMAPTSFGGLEAEDRRFRGLQSGLYFSHTSPMSIYTIDFSSNPHKRFPEDYAYKSICLSADGLSFADMPWALGDDTEAVSFYHKGVHTKTYLVSDLLKDLTKGKHSTSHVMWEDYQRRNCDTENSILIVSTNDDITYRFDITTGRMLGDSEQPNITTEDQNSSAHIYRLVILIVVFAAAVGAFIYLGRRAVRSRAKTKSRKNVKP